MAGEKRTVDDTLRSQLASSACEFDFYRLIWLLESYETQPVGTAYSPKKEQLRLGQQVSLNFPPSSIASANFLQSKNKVVVRILNLGLFGPHCPMPSITTEYIMRRVRNHRDKSLSEFVNFFQHRIFSLFYRSWALNNRCVDHGWGQEGKQTTQQASIIGKRERVEEEPHKLEKNVFLYYAGLFGRYTPNRTSVEAFVNDYFGVESEVEENVGSWLSIPEEEQAVLGVREETTTVGKTLVLGQRIWNANSRFRIHLLKLGYQQFLRFLPNHETFYKLKDFLDSYVGNQFECVLKVTVRAEEVPAVRLGKESFLGWNCWLGDQPHQSDASDYDVNLKNYNWEYYGNNTKKKSVR